jgi:hypothetical protein
LTYEDAIEPMRSYCRFIDSWSKPTRSLVSDFAAHGILLTTQYINLLVQEYGASVTNIRLVLEMKRTSKLKEFVDSNVRLRRLGDARGDPLMTSLGKLLSNAS